MLELRRHFVGVFIFCALAAPAAAQQTPANLKVAFVGDQGLGADPEAVLNLVKTEGAEALFVQGDFDYANDPAAWDAMLDGVLGTNFPVIGTVGNHDEAQWYGVGGYQDRLAKRMQRTGLTWMGDLGVQSTVNYKGLFMVQTSPGVFSSYDHATFIKNALAADSSIWSISGWHKLMNLMQVGGKGDETGWEVYEESRRGGAIVATAHEHSYSRTHLMSSMENQTVASTAQPLVLAADDSNTAADEGRSFAFVSGLGGASIRVQQLSGDWWASIYTSTQGADYGALFGVFNVNNDPRLAHFYFKDITGKVVDDFTVRSTLGQAAPPPGPTTTTTTSTTAPATTTTSTTSTTTTTTALATTTTTTTVAATTTTSTSTTTAPPATTTTTTTTSPGATSTTTTVPATSTTTTTTAPATTSTTAPGVTSTTTSSTSTTSTSVPPNGPRACSDGVDNDHDGRIDYPEDKGCDSPQDPYGQGHRRTRRLIRRNGVELPPAATAPIGPCWDGIDNDGDGHADYPKDRDCDAPDDPSELGPSQTRRLMNGLD